MSVGFIEQHELTEYMIERTERKVRIANGAVWTAASLTVLPLFAMLAKQTVKEKVLLSTNFLLKKEIACLRRNAAEQRERTPVLAHQIEGGLVAHVRSGVISGMITYIKWTEIASGKTFIFRKDAGFFWDVDGHICSKKRVIAAVTKCHETGDDGNFSNLFIDSYSLSQTQLS